MPTVGQIRGELNRDNLITKEVGGQRYVTTQEVLKKNWPSSLMRGRAGGNTASWA